MTRHCRACGLCNRTPTGAFPATVCVLAADQSRKEWRQQFAVSACTSDPAEYAPPRKKKSKDDPFVAYDDGTILDTKTKLMWAPRDSGKDISYKDAKSYCEKYQAGGYADWRMPTQDEWRLCMMQASPAGANLEAYHIATEFIELHSNAIGAWLSTRAREIGVIGFPSYELRWKKTNFMTDGLMMLPVRSVKAAAEEYEAITNPSELGLMFRSH